MLVLVKLMNLWIYYLLKIFQKDLYRLFDADYGVIVGRVLGQGVGIPNCRVSVFISLDEETTSTPSTLEDIKK
jgi:hypothetical protein